MSRAHPLIWRALATLALATGTLAAPATERGPTRAAAAEAASGSARVIVHYKSGAAMVQAAAAQGRSTAQHAATLGARLGLSLKDGRAMGSQQQVVHASGLDSATLAARIAQDAQVEWAVPDRRRHAAMVPNDPYFGSGQSSPMPPAGQWWLRGADATLVSATRMSTAWDSALGTGQVVAVLDTGVRTDHPDLSAKLLAGYNMISLNTAADGAAASGRCITGNGSCRNSDASDPGDWVTQSDVNQYPGLFDSSCIGNSSWHGTQVSGIVGASTDNGVGVAGSAPGAKILPVRVLGKCGGWDSDIIDGIRWAAGLSVSGVPANPNPARVINLSLGGSGACGAAYQTAINEVISQKQAVVVVAAGNEGGSVGAPANCSGVVAVGGLRHVGTKVGYSNLGSEVAISAPAGNCVNETGDCLYPIVSTVDSGATTPAGASYTDASNYAVGTSFSSPVVAGAAALMLSAKSTLTAAQVRSLLRSTARSFPTTGGDAGSPACRAPDGVAQDSECYCTTSTCGAGMLDAAAAVAAVIGVTPVITASPSSPVAGARVVLDASGSTVGSGRSIASHAWVLSAGSSRASFVSATNAAQATLDTTAAGSVTVQLTVTDDQGAAASTTLTLTVQSSALAAAITATPSAPSAGDSVALQGSATTDSGRSVAAWSWSVVSGDASFSGGTDASSATLLVPSAGSVTVRLTVTDDQGLQTTADRTLTVSAGTSSTSSGGGGAWSPLWALGLLVAGLALPRRRR